MLFVQDAYAAGTAASQNQAGLMSMLPMLLIFFGMMYFMVLRPQQKKANDHKSMLNDLAVGDEIVTAGGIMGKLLKMEGDVAILAIGQDCLQKSDKKSEKRDDNTCQVMFQKSSIASVLPKGSIKQLSA